MRLPSESVGKIKRIAMAYFGEDSRVYIFGSQLDDSQRGGDIDIYVETSIEDDDRLLNLKVFFIIELHRALGDRKIDVVINNLSGCVRLPIYEIARNEGVSI